MTSLKEKELRAYLKKAAERRAAQALIADSESGVAKEQKHVGYKTLLEACKPITATPLNAVAIQQDTIEATHGKEERGRKERSPSIPEDTSSSKKARIDEGIVTWWETFAEYTGEGKQAKSLWDSRFPVKNFVSDRVLFDDDRENIEAAGPEHAAIALQLHGLKIASLGHVMGREFDKLRLQERNSRKALEAAKKSIAEQPDLEKEVARLKKTLADQPDLAKEVERVKKIVEGHESSQKAREAELKKFYDDTIDEWNRKYSVACTKLEGKSATLKKKDADIEELKISTAGYLLTCFEKAKAQVRALHPMLDLDALSPRKTVKDGMLVEEQDEEFSGPITGGDEDK